jgi:rifampicin phosphotransferase
LAMLASVTDFWSEGVAYRQAPLQTRAQHHAERLANVAGWLEKRALSALMARAAGFIRIHEELRVWLVRSIGMLRTVLIDAERRLRRLDPSLPTGAAWHLSLPEISQALFTGRANLTSAVSARHKRRLRQLYETPRARYLKNLAAPEPGLQEAGPRLQGCYTGSGSFTGTVVRLGSLKAGQQRLGPRDVLVTPAADGLTALLMGFAGATISAVGHPLSHVATVARELGIPTVLGLGAAEELLEDGERVFVDGDRGFVERQA